MGTPEENVDMQSVLHRSFSDPSVPFNHRIRKGSVISAFVRIDHNKEAM